MGGRALLSQGIETVRIDTNTFNQVSNEINKILMGDGFKTHIVMGYSGKKDHGDIDILVVGNGADLRKYVEDVFSPRAIYSNGGCISFDYKNIQIDLINVKEENFESSINYYNNSDLGNLMGKLAHAMGLKFSPTGLFYRHKFNNTKLGDISITKDLGEICEVLDLDINIIKNGFSELEEIFVFITNSKYFDWKRVQYDQLGRVNSERDKKRKTYAKFIEWIDGNVKDDEHTFDDIDKKVVFKYINLHFPEAEIQTKARELDYRHTEKLYIQSKFNGGMVMRECGFTGKELGNKIECFREYVEENFKDYDTFILKNTSKEVMRQFKISCGNVI